MSLDVQVSDFNLKAAIRTTENTERKQRMTFYSAAFFRVLRDFRGVIWI
jgi:hypothetical protein